MSGKTAKERHTQAEKIVMIMMIVMTMMDDGEELEEGAKGK